MRNLNLKISIPISIEMSLNVVCLLTDQAACILPSTKNTWSLVCSTGHNAVGSSIERVSSPSVRIIDSSQQLSSGHYAKSALNKAVDLGHSSSQQLVILD